MTDFPLEGYDSPHSNSFVSFLRKHADVSQSIYTSRVTSHASSTV